MKEWHFLNPSTKHAEYRICIGVGRDTGAFFADLTRVSKEGKLMRSQVCLTIKEADCIRQILTEQGFAFVEAQ